MQMILIERCTFYLPSANFVRTKAKVRVSPKAGAWSLEDLPTAKIHNLSDFSKQIKKKYPQNIKCS